MHGKTAGNKGSRWGITANYDFYLMMLLPLIILVVFRYLPLYWNIISFFDYNVYGGLSNSEFIGLSHFKRFFTDNQFSRILSNTLIISIYKLVWGFPFPIMLALILNEVRNVVFKKTVQTLIYLPHFISWIIYGSIITSILSPSTGIINNILKVTGIMPVNFLASQIFFRPVLVVTSIIKEAGWGTIVYLAAITQIDPSLYESAEMDGAKKMRKIFSITLPSILPTVAMLLILRLGHLLSAGFEQIYILYNPSVYRVADVFETYIYRNGILGGDFGYTTAVGLFQSLVAVVLIVGANWLSRRFADYSMW
jgi:putative aldouronate transport system permease protein